MTKSASDSLKKGRLVLSVRELLEETGAVAPFGFQETYLSGVSIDSRKVKDGHLFFGLPGAKVHGQTYSRKAFDLGASVVFAEDLSQCCHTDGCTNLFIVESAEKALQQCARAVRRKIGTSIPLIGITGSNGKTTTKEVMATVLSGFSPNVHMSAGNFNNHLGLPVSLLSLPADSTVGVFEMGMSHRGEIDFLGDILQPTMAVITNVGEAHLENLGTVRNVALAKGELISHIVDDGLLLLNGNCPWSGFLSRRYSGRKALVGIGSNEDNAPFNAFFAATASTFDSVTGDLKILWKGRELSKDSCSIPVSGKHLVAPYLFALIAGLELGLFDIFEEQSMGRLWEKIFLPAKVAGRMETQFVKDVRFINDGYNANPDSVKAAIRFLAEAPGNNKIVLGEMLELGEGSENAHYEVASLAVELLGRDRVFLFGEVFRDVAHSLNVTFAGTVKDMVAEITGRIEKGDTLLFKASRGVAIERVAHGLGVFNKI